MTRPTPKREEVAFGVKEGHFLGYQIIQERIKPRLEKVEAVLNMTHPRTSRKYNARMLGWPP